jgi:chromosome segregation ATPase
VWLLVSEVRKGKRRRSSSSSSSDGVDALSTKKPDLHAPPPSLRLSEKSQTLELSISQRLVLLEALVHAQALQINRLSSDNQAQRKRIDEYEAELAAMRSEIGRVDGQVDKLELEVAEQREDIARLDGDVQYCLEREDEIKEAITDAVTDALMDRISERGLSASNVVFTLEKG